MIALFILTVYVGSEHDSLKGQEEGGAPTGIPSLPAVQKKSSGQVRSTSSGSEQSDDDEAEGEGEAETNQKMDPADAKRVRRLGLLQYCHIGTFHISLLNTRNKGTERNVSTHV